MAITQKVEPRTRRPNQRTVKSRTQKNRTGVRLESIFTFIQTNIKTISVLALLIAFWIGYKVLTGSQLFAVTEVEITQASPILRADVEQVVRKTIAQNRLMDVDLAVMKKEIEKIARVREATVARVLPNKIYVRVTERIPAVLVRRSSGNLVWVDADAIELGDFKLSELRASARSGETTKMPPSAIGFYEGNNPSASVIADNRERVALYKRLEQEFSAGQSLWDYVDEIDLSSLKYINVQVTTKELVSSPLKVVLGSTDFRQRFERAVQVLKALKERDAEMLGVLRVSDAQRLIENADRLNFLDVTKENVVFSFSSPSTERVSNAGMQAPPHPGAGANVHQAAQGSAKQADKKASVTASHPAAQKQASTKQR